jgi:hypothetical protein
VAPSPTLALSPTPVPRVPADGSIETGTYRIGPDSIRVTIPLGWEAGYTGTYIGKNPEQSTEVYLQTYPSDVSVYTDACQSGDALQSIGPSVDDLVTALRSQQNSDVSEPVDVTVGGRAAKRFEVSVPEGLDLAGCSIGRLQIWLAPPDWYLSFAEPTEVTTVLVVDGPSGRIVFTSGGFEDATDADLAELDAIIASMVIEDG